MRASPRVPVVGRVSEERLGGWRLCASPRVPVVGRVSEERLGGVAFVREPLSASCRLRKVLWEDFLVLLFPLSSYTSDWSQPYLDRWLSIPRKGNKILLLGYVVGGA